MLVMKRKAVNVKVREFLMRRNQCSFIRLLIYLNILLFCLSCEEKFRIWDNPHDLLSDKTEWEPTDLNIEQLSVGQIQLSWEDMAKGEDGYRIDRKKQGKSWVTEFALLPENTTEWIDSTDVEMAMYWYKVYCYAGENITDPIEGSVQATGHIFSVTFGSHNSDQGYSVQQTTDGGYVITGFSEFSGVYDGPDVFLIKTDSNGSEEWNRKIDDNSGRGYSVQQTTDGGYIITGSAGVFGNHLDVSLYKTDFVGNEQWRRTFGAFNSPNDDIGNSVQQTTDGGYIITGWTLSFGNGNTDVWLIKTDSNGDSLWTQTFGRGKEDRGNSVQQTTDGGYIITGSTNSFGDGLEDVWLIKTDSDGDSLWTQIFDGEFTEWGNSVQQTTDGGYIITGWTNSFGNGGRDVWLIKTDFNGDSLWTQTFGGEDYDWGNSVQQTTDGGYIITGTTTSEENGTWDVWLIKTNSKGINLGTFPTIQVPTDFHLDEPYPNPFNPTTTVKFSVPQSGFVSIKVYDLIGNEVSTLVNSDFTSGNHIVQWDGSGQTTGIYFVRMESGGFVQTKKVMLMK